MGIKDNILGTFRQQDTLSPDIWVKYDNVDEFLMQEDVREQLIEIATKFIEFMDIGADTCEIDTRDCDIIDMVVTGSIANYNWSKFSDIDIHIVLDFEMINDNREMVKKFFDAVRANWNKLHNIFVKGHEVEIYVQDMREPHFSTGVYSLENDQWLVKPKKVKPHIDKETATKKMKHIAREINKLSLLYDNKQYERSFELAERLKEKIKRMRRSGLEKTGIYSPENLAFKMLRRSGDIEQLFSIYTQAYDKIYSLDQ